MTDSKNIIVVGAGIAGMNCALQLQRDGHRVTVVDRLDPGEGCSFGNAGFISPGSATPRATPKLLRKVPGYLLDRRGPLHLRWSYLPQAMPWLLRFARASDPRVVETGKKGLRALHAPAFDIYDSLIDTSDIIRRLGQLHIFETDAAFAESRALNEQRRASGIAVEELDQAALRQMVPELSSICRHALFFPDNGHTVSPVRLVRTLADRFASEGGTVERRSVEGFETTNGNVTAVRSSEGSDTADLVVIAAGAWSARLTRQLGDAVPLETQRGYHLELPTPGVSLRIGLQSHERNFTITPMENGLRMAGTAEFAGLDAPPDYRRARMLYDHTKRFFPDLRDDDAREWMGHRPTTPDSLPVVDRASRHANVYYAFGHGHTGLSGSPMTGKLIADMVAGREPSIDPTPYRLSRF